MAGHIAEPDQVTTFAIGLTITKRVMPKVKIPAPETISAGLRLPQVCGKVREVSSVTRIAEIL